MANTVSDIERQRESFQAEFKRVHQEISKIIVGYSDIIDDILMTILGKGHVLLEGVPGPGEDEAGADTRAMRCTFDLRESSSRRT